MATKHNVSPGYDAIVVGARCAGSPTAMLLARKGYRVLLVDRATFPSDTTSTHAIRMPGIRMLQRWGLLDAIARTNCPPVRTVTFDMGDYPLRGTVPPHPDGLAMCAPRRTVLDTILVEAAARDGAEVRTGFAVTGLLTEGDRVVGIRGHAKDGRMVEERARLVVGADGKHSFVARTVGAPAYHDVSPLECGYYTYWSDVATDSFELYVRPTERQAILLVRTNDGACAIAVFAHRLALAAYRADVEGTYLRRLGLVPDLAERVRAGRRIERFHGASDLPNFFRRPFGPGWALVGDAGFCQDPFPAWGISDAFRDAQALTDAIDAGSSGNQDLEEALAAYARHRDELSLPTYEETLRAATLGPPPPEQIQLRAALRDNQPETERFLGATFGGESPEEFFSPANLGRIIGQSMEAKREAAGSGVSP